MRRLILTALSGLAVMIAPSARAAESLDEAVAAIAQRFVNSRINEAEPVRVAVTAFVQADRKTTQFTNLLVSALTGKLVELGNDKVRVVERAQFDAAWNEIQLSDVSIFDPDSAKEIGNFLGVDALIVGEITPMYDHVRLDARMIDVETIETIEQAYDWVPLTPTVTNQLSSLAIVARPSIGGDEGPDPRNGIWRGTGTCGENTIGLALSIIVTPDDKISAMQTYYPVAQGDGGGNAPSGTLAMGGTYDAASNEFTLLPGDWLYRPRGHAALGISGTMDTASGVITAQYDREGCGEVSLRRLN